MAEYIEKHDVVSLTRKCSRYNLWWIYEPHLFEELEKCKPADVVDVVRCKDCIHRPSRIPGASDDHEGLNLEFTDDWCPMQCEDGWYNIMPRDDFFCGYGERKENHGADMRGET